MDSATIKALAQRLTSRRARPQPGAPAVADHPDITIADAYAIQREWVASKIAAGRRLVGHKIGLTSRAMQLCRRRSTSGLRRAAGRHAVRRRAEIPRDRYIVPRVEVELAFILSAACKGRTRRCSTCWTPCAT